MVERESRIVARGALQIAQTFSRAEEAQQKALLAKEGVKAVGVDYGGEFTTSIGKIVERAVVAARGGRDQLYSR